MRKVILTVTIFVTLIATSAYACTTSFYLGDGGRLIVCTTCSGITTCN
jgi:hypothetical protein